MKQRHGTTEMAANDTQRRIETTKLATRKCSNTVVKYRQGHGFLLKTRRRGTYGPLPSPFP